MVASSILTPREGTPGVRDALDATDEPDVRWFLAQTPEERRVPRAQSERHRWMRGLNVKAESDYYAILCLRWDRKEQVVKTSTEFGFVTTRTQKTNRSRFEN
jgi:hypothetical protein